MKMFVIALFSLFFISACNKEKMVVFDITVMNVDNSVVTEGFVRILGYRNGIGGIVTLYEEELPLSDKGEIHLEISVDSKITEFHIEYQKDTNVHTPQTITGCNHEFSPSICELSGGQKIFEIEIIVL